MQIESTVAELVNLLSAPIALSLLGTHPNDIGAHLNAHLNEEQSIRSIPDAWRTWWLWADKCPNSWERLIAFNDFCQGRRGEDPADSTFLDLEFPDELRKLIQRIDHITLPRYANVTPLTYENSTLESKLPPKKISPKGMSPKKLHEVNRLMAYILYLLDHIYKITGMKVKHVVDIGAGQVRTCEKLCLSYENHHSHTSPRAIYRTLFVRFSVF